MPSSTIRLVNCDLKLLEAILAGDEALSRYLHCTIAAHWSTFGSEVFSYSLKQITSDPASQPWWAYLIILQTENTLLGSCGFKGKPDASGSVELGYEIAEAFRNRGLATEVTRLLLAKAFATPEVKVVKAHTLAKPNPSVKVLEKNGFTLTQELLDPEEGKIWLWILPRSSYE